MRDLRCSCAAESAIMKGSRNIARPVELGHDNLLVFPRQKNTAGQNLATTTATTDVKTI